MVVSFTFLRFSSDISSTRATLSNQGLCRVIKSVHAGIPKVAVNSWTMTRFPPSIPIPCVFWFQTVKHDIEHQNTFGSGNCTIYRHDSFLHIFILISKSPIKFQMINVFEPYLCNFVFMCMIIHISLRHRDTAQNNIALHDTT